MTTYFKIQQLDFIFFMLLILMSNFVNQKLFTIQSKNYFLYLIFDYKNLKFKHLINNITIDL